MSTEKKILIVEDELLIAKVYAMVLQKEGYTVCGTATHLERGLELFREHHPECIIMDIQLARGTSGIDLARIIRKESRVPILFTTGNSRNLVADQVTEIGNFEILIKPVDTHYLTIAVKRAFSGEAEA